MCVVGILLSVWARFYGCVLVFLFLNLTFFFLYLCSFVCVSLCWKLPSLGSNVYFYFFNWGSCQMPLFSLHLDYSLITQEKKRLHHFHSTSLLTERGYNDTVAQCQRLVLFPNLKVQQFPGGKLSSALDPDPLLFSYPG